MNTIFAFENSTANPFYEGVRDIHPSEVLKYAQEVILVDVRSSEEYIGELGHIKNSQLITLNELPQKLFSLPNRQPLVFICRSGNRAAQAAAFATQSGYSHTYNMQGGMTLWNHLSLPTEKGT